MILSVGRRYLFIHIPKTGGTALSLALESRALKNDILIGDTPKARNRAGRLRNLKTAGRLWKHSTLSDLDGLIDAADLNNLFVLTVVRNPWDRIVSLYHWGRAQNFAHPMIGLAKMHDFSGFLNHPQTQMALRLWPARCFTQDSAGVDRATLCARLEHLAEDLAPFETHLGFRLRPVERVNESERNRDWRGYYNPSNADLVAHLCAEDIARFGYGFDPA
jgi:hypothetical protein